MLFSHRPFSCIGSSRKQEQASSWIALTNVFPADPQQIVNLVSVINGEFKKDCYLGGLRSFRSTVRIPWSASILPLKESSKKSIAVRMDVVGVEASHELEAYASTGADVTPRALLLSH